MTQIVEPIQIDEDFKQWVDDAMSFTEEEQLADQTKLQASKRNPAVFLREMIGMEPHYWQAYFFTKGGGAIRGGSNKKKHALVTSRQIGKSTSLATLGLWCSLFNHASYGAHNTTKVGSFSMKDKQAKKLMREIKNMMISGDYSMRERAGFENYFTDLINDDAPNNKTTISFKQDTAETGPFFKGAKVGPSIRTYPPTDTVLGETFSLGFIDEAAKVDDEFYDEVFRQTMNASDGVQVFTSTPWGANGFFYELLKNNEALNVETYAFDIDALEVEDSEQARIQLQSVRNDIEAMKQRGKTDTIRRQFYCDFVQTTNQFFDPELVDNMFDKSLEQPAVDVSEPVDIGIDFGGSRSSHTVITISHYDEDEEQVTRVWHKRYDIQDDLGLLDDLAVIREKFNVQRIVPEECPAGDHFIQKMENRGWNIHPVKPAGEKTTLYNNFDDMFRRGQVRSYEDEKLREEMKALEEEETRRTTRIEAPPNYTDDMIDSFVLSCKFFFNEDTDTTESLFSRL